MNAKFLGRPIFDERTMTWVFPDGSGRIVDEARIEMEIGTGNEREGDYQCSMTAVDDAIFSTSRSDLRNLNERRRVQSELTEDNDPKEYRRKWGS